MLETDLFGVKTEYRDPGVWMHVHFEAEFQGCYLISGTGFVRTAEFESITEDNDDIYCEIDECDSKTYFARKKVLNRKGKVISTYLSKREMTVQS